MEQKMTVIGTLLADFIEKYGREVLAEVSDEKRNEDDAKVVATQEKQS